MDSNTKKFLYAGIAGITSRTATAVKELKFYIKIKKI